MEKTEQVTYTFKEKYFSLDKEKRIGKRQFQTRVFVPGILMGFAFLFVGPIVGPILTIILAKLFIGAGLAPIIIGMLVGILPMLVIYGTSLFFMPTVIKKRAHDFGSTGVTEVRLFLGGFIVFIIIVALIVREVSSFSEFIPIDILIQARDCVRYGIIALIIYLMFRSGTKGNNEYGEDTSNLKIGFLG